MSAWPGRIGLLATRPRATEYWKSILPSRRHPERRTGFGKNRCTLGGKSGGGGLETVFWMLEYGQEK
ncbi:hypothetical protein L596_028359 [Steinernema carpocapsae]|uniref:Uncharacterized protein n=1 Tax=Steinernema carpocapsae TaxID=34508 RepID=A0A4U5LY70_STECR|nr:hypothetical protein L596_028359 [Steinernema carpocapsae]